MRLVLFFVVVGTSAFAKEYEYRVSLNIPQPAPVKPILVPPAPAPIINNQNANSLFGNASNYFNVDKEILQNHFIILFTRIQQWFYEHRTNLMWGAAGCIIAYLYYVHWKAEQLLESPSWSSWCLSHDPATMSSERILIAIHQQHLTDANINNSCLLFATFLKTVEEEQTILRRASMLDSLLSKLYIATYFTRRISKRTQALQELQELRIRFIEWYAREIITRGFHGT